MNQKKLLYILLFFAGITSCMIKAMQSAIMTPEDELRLSSEEKISLKPKAHLLYFTTERCSIRLVSRKDHNNLYYLFTHPQAATYIYGSKLTEQEINNLKTLKNKMLLKILLFLRGTFPKSFGYQWVVEDKNSKKFLGSASATFLKEPQLFNLDNSKKYLSVGCELLPEYHQKGFATEIGNVILNQLILYKSYLKFDTLIAGTNCEHEVAKKLMQKLGFNFLKEVHFQKSPFGVSNKPFDATIFVKELPK